jgi:hypothetical protein
MFYLFDCNGVLAPVGVIDMLMFGAAMAAARAYAARVYVLGYFVHVMSREQAPFECLDEFFHGALSLRLVSENALDGALCIVGEAPALRVQFESINLDAEPFFKEPACVRGGIAVAASG